MKFGKSLVTKQVPEWSHSYLNYKDLKQKINVIVQSHGKGFLNSSRDPLSDTPGIKSDVEAFLFSFDRNIEKINFFYNKNQNEYLRRLKNITTLFENNESIEQDNIDEDLLNILLELRSDLRNLKWFGELNTRGCIKILKKFDKKTGSKIQQLWLNTKVYVCRFTSNTTVEESIVEVNKLLSELSKNNDDDHDSDSDSDSDASDSDVEDIENNDKRINDNNSYLSSKINELKELIKIDDIDNFKLILTNLKKDSENHLTNKLLLSLLIKSTIFSSFKCIKYLLDNLSTLIDSSEMNQRNFFHLLIINLGKQTQLIHEGISPAEKPLLQSILKRTYGTDGINSNDKIDSIEFILNNLPIKFQYFLNENDAYKRKPLHYSSQYGLHLITKVLIQYLKKFGLFDSEESIDDVSSYDCYNLSPLQLSIIGKHTLTFTELVGSMVRGVLLKNNNLLLLSCSLGCYEITRILIEYGLDINFQDSKTGEAPLHLSVKNNYLDIVKLLLNSKNNKIYGKQNESCNLELKENKFGWTPIFLSATKGFLDITKVLIDSGANYSSSDESGWSPVEHACLRGHLKVAELLKPITHLETRPFLTSHKSSTNEVEIIRKNNTNKKNKVRSGSKSPKLGSSPTLPPTVSPSSIENTEAVTSIGHRYLTKHSMILVTLGSPDTQFNSSPIKINKIPYSKASSTQLDTALSLIVSASHTSGESSVVDLPIKNNDTSTEPIIFHSLNPSKVILYFDIVPSYSATSSINKKSDKKNTNPPIGRAVAILDSVLTNLGNKKRSLHELITVPIMKSDTMEILGTISFQFIVIKPFHHKSLGIDKKTNTYWKSLISNKTNRNEKIIGHRGMGKNNLIKKSLQLGENTVDSLIAAANLGLSYVEFDVQLTKDYKPVIYHDFLVAETGIDSPMYTLTSEQFLGLSEQRKISHDLLYHRNSKTDDTNENESENVKKINNEIINKVDNKFDDKIENIDGSKGGIDFSINNKRRNRAMSFHLDFRTSDSKELELINDKIKHTRDFKNKGFKGNTPGLSIYAPFTTLEEVFKLLPKKVGFNIECKYPTLSESEDEDMEDIQFDLNFWVDTILNCVYDFANDRDILFSSFHPDICILLSMKQPSIPVLFLTESGFSPMRDVRCSSLHEAIRFAKRWDLLGIVTESSPLLMCPRLINVVKGTGLLVVTYGNQNDTPEAAKIQMDAGVDAVIVDSVLAVRKGLTTMATS